DALWIARRVRTRTRLDMALAALVMALACVLGCVPIRNSDVWVHMAAGRQLASQPRGEADPFVHTASTGGALSSSWLFDVLSYGVFTATGSAGVGGLRAVAVILLAGAMVWAGRQGPGVWVSATCSTLALLAITPWFQMQPMLVSM